MTVVIEICELVGVKLSQVTRKIYAGLCKLKMRSCLVIRPLLLQLIFQQLVL